MITHQTVDTVWIITATGRISWKDFDSVEPKMARILSSSEPLRLVVDYQTAEGFTFTGFVREFVALARLFKYRKARGRCGVLTAENFTDGVLHLEDKFQPNLETKFFKPSEREAAITWARAIE